MAMGDNIRSRNRINYADARGENLYSNANAFLGAQGQQFQGDYGRALQSDEQMRNAAMGGFQNFINTGGFSPGDISALRSRGVSPIRSAYAGAKRDIMRQQGSTAGRGALLARMAREQGQSAADATTNVNAGIAQMVQQGKLAGNTGMTSLYGTTPGNTGLQSRNVLQNAQQGLDLTGMEYNRMQGIMGAQNQAATLAGKGQTALNNILNTASTVRDMFRPTKS